jgi:hypothetical protein
MGVKNSKQARQIKNVEDRVMRQLKEMLKDRGFEVKYSYTDTVSYRLTYENGNEYEIKDFTESLDNCKLSEVLHPWILDLMMFHSHWYKRYYTDADENFAVDTDAVMYDFLDVIFDNSQL